MATILLVDDHPDIRDALRSMLESDRHTVVEAKDGHEAIASWQAHKADLVLTDFSMPGLNGLDVIQAIATEHPDTPIILMSGAFGNDSLPPWLAQFPSARFLQKPFTNATLRQSISESFRTEPKT